MSGAGMNPFAYYDPQDYAAQLAIQRQQALGQQLMQQPMGTGGYAGLAEAGNRLLGAFLSRRADQKLADYYNQPDAQTGQQAAQSQPRPAAPVYSNANLDEEGNPIPQQQSAPMGGYSTGAMDERPSVPGNRTAMDEKPSDYYSLPPRFQRLYDRIPHIPGMPAAQAVGYFETNPAGYQAEWAKQFEATPEQKNAAFVNPGDSEAQRAAIGGIMAKNAAIPVRNMVAMPDGKGGTRFMYAPPQAPPGHQYVTGNDGQLMLIPIPYGTQAVANSAAANAYGQAGGKLGIGYDQNNQPVGTSRAALIGNPNIPGVMPFGPQPVTPPNASGGNAVIPGVSPSAVSQVESRGNPYAVSPAGAQGPMQTMPGTLRAPGYGVAPAQNNTPGEQARVGTDYLGAMQSRYNNPVLAHIAYNMGPDATDKWLAAGGDFSKLPDETQKYLGRVAVAQAMQGRQAQAPQTAPKPLLPELPAGQSSYMQAQAKDAADRHDANIAAAADSKMRVNVLDNISDLSERGVATGYGQDWQNRVLGTAANLPGISKLMGPAKDNVAKFQVLQKFLQQNGQRAWAAAGGTQTNAQLETAFHAQPNDQQFPQALQTVTKWVKAGELAVQGKANAQDQWLAQKGQTPQNQIAFENAWRNNFDPRVFQYSLMTPQEKLNFAHTQLKTPQAAKAFLAKQQTLKAMGAIQ